MKTLKIKIKSREEANRELRSIAKNLDSRKKKNFVEKNRLRGGIFFESLTAVRKILTDKRLDVWRTIRDERPDSITHLAKILGRGFRSVHRDVILLEELGLIEMNIGPGQRGNVQQLVSRYDELLLTVG